MRKISFMVAAGAAMLAADAGATNGYFATGYGLKAKGLAGAGIALPQDSLAAAINPAGLALVGDRLDAGAEWTRFDQGASIGGNATPFSADGDYSGRLPARAVPEVGISRALSPDLVVGLAVFGNRFASHYQPAAFTTGRMASLGGHYGAASGVSIEQRFAAASVAFMPSHEHSVGASLIYARQRFGAEGLYPFSPASVDSSSLASPGPASGGGLGMRLGWAGAVREGLALAATWASRIRVRHEPYRGLLPAGRLDIPENFGFGLALRPTARLAFAADWQRIRYGQVLGGSANCVLTLQCTLGTAGAGFGWRDMNVMRLGGTYEAGGGITLRAGASLGRAPISENQTLLNTLLPAVIEKHLAFGATWQFDRRGEISAAYTRGFGNTVAGAGSIGGVLGGVLGGGEANLRARHDAIAIGFGLRY